MLRFSVVETLSAKHVERVEIGVIEAGEQICLCEGIEVGEVADHAGCGIDLAAEGDLHGVVVAVAVGVVAFAEDVAVLRCVVGLGVQAVRGAEVIAAIEVGFHALTIVVGEEIGHLVDADAVEFCVGDLVVETLPDGDGDVFCRGDGGFELGDFEVEVAVIVDADDLALEDVFELL